MFTTRDTDGSLKELDVIERAKGPRAKRRPLLVARSRAPAQRIAQTPNTAHGQVKEPARARQGIECPATRIAYHGKAFRLSHCKMIEASPCSSHS